MNLKHIRGIWSARIYLLLVCFVEMNLLLFLDHKTSLEI